MPDMVGIGGLTGPRRAPCPVPSAVIPGRLDHRRLHEAFSFARTWRLHGRAMTTRLRRPRRCRSQHQPVHRIPLHVRDDRDPPLVPERNGQEQIEHTMAEPSDERASYPKLTLACALIAWPEPRDDLKCC